MIELTIYIDSEEVYVSDSSDLMNVSILAYSSAILESLNKNNKREKIIELEESYQSFLINKYYFGNLFTQDRLSFSRLKHLDKMESEFHEELLSGHSKRTEIKFALDAYKRGKLDALESGVQFEGFFVNPKNHFEKHVYINPNDFLDWINYSNRNNVARIRYASSENSIEYVLAFLFYWGIEQYSFTKDILVYFSRFLKMYLEFSYGNFRSERTETHGLKIPDLPPNMKNTIRKYKNVELEYGEGENKIRLILRN